MTATRVDRPTFFIWALIVLGVLYLVAAGGGGFFGSYIIEFRVASVAFITVAILAWVVAALRDPFWLPRSVLWPSLLSALVALIVGLLGSSTPRLGADYVAYAILLTAGYLLLQRLYAHQFFGSRLGSLTVLLAFALCVTYLGTVVFGWIEFWADVGRIVSPPLRPGFAGLGFGNPGAVATASVLLWLASVSQLGLTASRARWLVGSLTVLVAWVVFLSGSRAAWVGLALTLVVMVPLWFTTAEHRRQAWTMLRDGRVRLGLVVSGGAAVVAAILFLPALVARLTEPASETRSAFFATALRMFAEDPLTGTGPGTWVVRRIALTETGETDYYIPHAHNIVLQTMAELGIVGLLAGAVVAVNLVLLVRFGITSTAGLDRRLGWATLAALIYLLVHQMFDSYATATGIPFLFALIVARIDAMASEVSPTLGFASPRLDAGQRRTGSLVAVAIIGVGTIVAAGWLLRSEAAAMDAQRASEAANDGRWDVAHHLAQRAVAADPDLPPYQFTLGLTAAHAGDLVAARAAFRQGAAVDDSPITWLDLAKVEHDLGDDDAARDALSTAMRLGRQHPHIAVAAASLFLDIGDIDAAASAMADAIAIVPSLAGDAFWESSTNGAEASRAATRNGIESTTPATGYRIALEAGMIDEARRLVEAIPDADREVPSLVTEAWTGDRDAFDRLHERAIANPLDDKLVALCRRVAARSMDSDWPGAEPLTCDRAGRPASMTIVWVDPAAVDRQPSRLELPVTNAPWHVEYTYRRVAPNDELVPGLPHLRGFIP